MSTTFRTRGRHHNTKGLRQIKRGRTREQVVRIAKRLGVPHERNLYIEWLAYYNNSAGNGRDGLSYDKWLKRTCDHKFIDSKHCLKCGWNPDA